MEGIYHGQVAGKSNGEPYSWAFGPPCRLMESPTWEVSSSPPPTGLPPLRQCSSLCRPPRGLRPAPAFGGLGEVRLGTAAAVSLRPRYPIRLWGGTLGSSSHAVERDCCYPYLFSLPYITPDKSQTWRWHAWRHWCRPACQRRGAQRRGES